MLNTVSTSLGYKPSRCNVMRQKANTRTIPCVTDVSGKKLYSNNNLNSAFKSYYEKVYKSKTTVLSDQDIEDFPDNLNLSKK